MSNQEWKILKDDRIVNILDGSLTIGDIVINGKKHQIKLKYLSGPSICNLSYDLGHPMNYTDENGNAMSRWVYFDNLLDYAIESHKVSALLSTLFSRKNASEALDTACELQEESIDYLHLIPIFQKKAINVVNNVLGISGVKLCFSRKTKKWSLRKIDIYSTTYSREKNNKIAQLNKKETKHDGFYILPFTKEPISIMHAIQDKLKAENIQFSLNKSGDIFEKSRGDDILKNIFSDIKSADILVADVSEKNPNVFYELGLAQAWNKQVIIICSKKSLNDDYSKKLPFDISTRMILFYGSTYDDIKEISRKVTDKIKILLGIRDDA